MTNPVSFAAVALAILYLPVASNAAELNVRLGNAPTEGTLVFQVYDAADAFGDLRDPAREIAMPARGDGDYVLSDIGAGQIAVLVFHDENANGILDKNFIGIPREPLAISNNYQPKGPPSFARASFKAGSGESSSIELEMYGVLGAAVPSISRAIPCAFLRQPDRQRDTWP